MEQTTLLVLSKTRLESIDWLLQYYAEFLFCRFSTNAYWAAGSCLFHSRLIDLIEGHSPKQLSPSLPFERYLKQSSSKGGLEDIKTDVVHICSGGKIFPFAAQGRRSRRGFTFLQCIGDRVNALAGLLLPVYEHFFKYYILT